MRLIPKIKLYGASGCHKTHYYQLLLDDTKLRYTFLDVEADEAAANELRGLYENGKLNFPTITIGAKKLRNPNKETLEKWLNNLIPSRLPLVHDAENKQFTMDINGEIAKVTYQWKNGVMHLVHSEVPYNLRGSGIGKELVLKTFEKLTEEGYKAKAICSFVKAIAQRNDQWNSIIK